MKKLILCLAVLLVPSFARAEFDISYLEALEPKEGTVYLRPSEIHEDYRMVVYVNVSENTPAGQRMWVFERNKGDAPWQLALWDQNYWTEQGLLAGETPDFSWVISSGRRYSDTVRSGPTPIGFFNIDERKWRHSRGWVRHDIVDIMYIDLHYSSGRASGVAFHGTPESEYKYLGQAESHGCVRMHQGNARDFYDYIHRYDGLAKSDNPLWGQMPRFYRSVAKNSVRQSYRRDGQLLRDSKGNTLKKNGYRIGLMFFSDSEDGRWPDQLTYRPSKKPLLTGDKL